MGRKLATYVHVHRGDASVVLQPGDELPDWAAELVTNPAVFGEEPASSPAPRLAAGKPPTRSGPGSGRDTWADYADANGVEINKDDSRDQIIAKVDAAGVPTS